MGMGVRATYFVFVGFASVLVAAANFGYQTTWYSVANTLFGWVSTSSYIQGYALDILILGTAYLFAFLSVSGIKREGANDEKQKWADRMSS